MKKGATVTIYYLAGDDPGDQPVTATHVEHFETLDAARDYVTRVAVKGATFSTYPTFPATTEVSRFVPPTNILHIDLTEATQMGMQVETTDALFASRPLATVAGMSPSLLLDIPEPPAGILNRIGGSHD